MNLGLLLRIICCVVGVLIMWITLKSLARRKMNESFCLAWGIISLAIFLAGLLLKPDEISRYISPAGFVLIILIFFCVVYAAYFVSIKVSELTRQKQELAIEVSLLREENVRILRRLEHLEEVNEESTLRN